VCSRYDKSKKKKNGRNEFDPFKKGVDSAASNQYCAQNCGLLPSQHATNYNDFVLKWLEV
jgi:hypothetical protein